MCSLELKNLIKKGLARKDLLVIVNFLYILYFLDKIYKRANV